MNLATINVYSDDSAWRAQFQYDNDGPLDATWFYQGKQFPYEPPPTIRVELERRAWDDWRGRDLPDEDYL